LALADSATIRAALSALLADADQRRRVYALAVRAGRAERASDLVNAACVKLLAGERAWDRDESPDLVSHLGGIMASLASNERTGGAARRMQLHGDPDSEERAPDGRGDAESRNLEEARERRVEQRLERWLAALRTDRGSDPQSLRLIDCFERGVLKAADQVRDTGWQLADVRRVRRRLFDRAALVMRAHPDDSGTFAAQEAS
jgi:hypothetical protein